MKKRQKLGQHFLKSKTIAKSIVNAAKISNKDIVLEIGTGKGILIPFLCQKAKKVISIESDKNLYDAAKSHFSGISNLVLILGDGFKTEENFTIFVSNLPYSQTRHAIEWLIQRKFSLAIIMVQKEFASKLLDKKKAISVLANYALEIDEICKVNRNNFSPPPKVDSVVLQLKKRRIVSKELIITVNKLFSFRRKTIQNILKEFGKKVVSKKRLDDLTGDEIIRIAKQIIQK